MGDLVCWFVQTIYPLKFAHPFAVLGGYTPLHLAGIPFSGPDHVRVGSSVRPDIVFDV